MPAALGLVISRAVLPLPEHWRRHRRVALPERRRAPGAAQALAAGLVLQPEPGPGLEQAEVTGLIPGLELAAGLVLRLEPVLGLELREVRVLLPGLRQVPERLALPEPVRALPPGPEPPGPGHWRGGFPFLRYPIWRRPVP